MPYEASDFITMLEDMVGKTVADRLEEAGMGKAQPKTVNPQVSLLKKRDQLVKETARIWANNGVHPETGMGVDWQHLTSTVMEAEDKLAREYLKANRDAGIRGEDLQSSPDIMLVLPKVVSEMIMEPIQYAETLSPLLRTVSVKGGRIDITYPAVGAMGGQRLDMAEGGEYPEATLDMAGVMNVKIGKSGIAVRWTEEMRRYSQFDLMAMLLRGAARALARWKDKKVADHILALGRNSFNNSTGSPASTTGRGADGNYNGTFSIDDMFTMYAEMVNKGYTPNTLIMHPMAWLIFARDPHMRSLANLRGGPFFKTVRGELPYAGKFETNGMALGPNLGLGGESALAKMYTPTYGAFPHPLDVVVSPAMPFSTDGSGRYLTDIVMCDRDELGVLFVDEPPTTDRWDDPARDIYKVKIRERYAIAILNQGEAVRTAKNVVIDRNYDLDDKVTWDVSNSALPSGTFTL